MTNDGSNNHLVRLIYFDVVCRNLANVVTLNDCDIDMQGKFVCSKLLGLSGETFVVLVITITRTTNNSTCIQIVFYERTQKQLTILRQVPSCLLLNEKFQ